MFGSAARVPRPVLFVLVYGIFLVIVGVTATAQTMLVSSNFSTSTLSSVVGTDAALIRSVVNTYVSPGDIDADGPTATRRASLEADLARLVRRAEILRVELRRPDGTIIASDRRRRERTCHEPGRRTSVPLPRVGRSPPRSPT